MIRDEDRPPLDPHPLSDYVAWAGRRNRDPILNLLRTKLPDEGSVLELASGSGMHINYFAPRFPKATKLLNISASCGMNNRTQMSQIPSFSI